MGSHHLEANARKRGGTDLQVRVFQSFAADHQALPPTWQLEIPPPRAWDRSLRRKVGAIPVLLGWFTTGFALGRPGLRLYPVLCSPHPTYSSQMARRESSPGLGPLPISQQDLWACSWREQAVRGSLDGFGSFLAGWFGWVFFFFLHFRGLFVCLVLTVFSLFPAGALPRGPAGCLCFGGVVESKDFCAHHPCCEMQTCACFASLAET